MSEATINRPILFSAYLKARESKRSFSPVTSWGILFLSAVVLAWGASVAVGIPAALTLLTLLGFGAAIIGLWMPIPGLLGIGLLCTVDAVTRHYLLTGGLLRWNTLNYWLLFLIALYSVRLLTVNYLPLRLLIAFCSLMALQLVYSPDIMSGVQHFIGIAAALALVVYFIRGTKERNIWLWLAVINGTCSAVGGMMFSLFQSKLPPINPNAYVYFPLTGLLSICLSYRFAQRGPSQLILQLLALVNTGWVFLTASRGGMLMAACCLLYLIFSTRKVSQFLGIIFLGAVLGGVFSGRFTDMENYSMHRIQKLFASDRTWAERTSGRSELVMGGWYMFLENPFGIGTGGYRAKYADVSSKKLLTYGSGSEKAAHSGWIKTLAENGIIGMALFGAFVCSFAYIGFKNRRAGVFGLGMLVTLVLATAFISTEFQGKGLWFLCAGALVILYRGYANVRPKAPASAVQPNPAR